MKKAIIIIAAIAALLIITNPTPGEFKDFVTYQAEDREVKSLRTGYYFFFSTYEYKEIQDNDYYSSPKKYRAFLKSFFEVIPPQLTKEEIAIVDSIAQRTADSLAEAAQQAADAALASVDWEPPKDAIVKDDKN